jgi:hypothetical protein
MADLTVMEVLERENVRNEARVEIQRALDGLCRACPLARRAEALVSLKQWLTDQTDSMCEKRRFDALGEVLTAIDEIAGQ